MHEMSRLLVVSNRLSVSVARRAGNIVFRASVGGLATGLASLSRSYERFWIGWPGVANESLKSGEKQRIREKLTARKCHPVFLCEGDIENFYEGFCNRTIWPLFHYFPLYSAYEEGYWQAYKRVNEAFRNEVLQVAQPDDCIWIHDYQLMLLPQLIREVRSAAQIGFFLHIPFPSFELFRLLPWREELLNGLLGADLIGFHTYDYVRHFLSSACRIAGHEHHTLGQLTVGNRLVKVDAFPMGIDYEKYSGAANKPKVQKELAAIRQRVGDRRIIISIDRLDYTKGIIERLEAFDLFLSENPEYRGKVTMILLAVPSRTGVENYMVLRNQLEALVGRVNGEHGSLGWVPVWYLYRAVPFERLTALYNLADVALITPLRDGMNLIAKEFVAAKINGLGVLILSEMAGAARELGEAVIVNAHNKAAMIGAIKEALEMPAEEQVARNRLMQERLSRYDFSRWVRDFLEGLSCVKETQQELSVRKLGKEGREKLICDYTQSPQCLILLDYDGTLVDFVDRPDRAEPDDQLLELLQALAKDPQNSLVIVSGRQKGQLVKWFGHLNAALVGEHGGWIKEGAMNWTAVEPLRTDWKETIRPIMELYADRTPGSIVEDKDFSLVWHCRRTDPALAYVRMQELKDAVMNMTENLGVAVFEGNNIIEVKSTGVNKGRAVELWLNRQNWDFILAVGDDYTDEDMFEVLPERAYSIKVGLSLSKARFNVDSVREVRALLEELLRS